MGIVKTQVSDKNSRMVLKASTIHLVHRTFGGADLEVTGVRVAVYFARFDMKFL